MIFKTVSALIISLMFLASCIESQGSDQNTEHKPLSELEYFEQSLSKNKLNFTQSVDSIPQNIMQYMISIDSNFEMVSKGEPWQIGCSPPITIDSSLIKTSRDPETGELITTIGISNSDVPNKELQISGWCKESAFLVYKSGGFGSSQYLLLFHINKNLIINHWRGQINGNIVSTKDVLLLLKSGKFKAG